MTRPLVDDHTTSSASGWVNPMSRIETPISTIAQTKAK
jgi:hypothetical protein